MLQIRQNSKYNLLNKNENYEIAHRENETITQASDTITLEELKSRKIEVKN